MDTIYDDLDREPEGPGYAKYVSAIIAVVTLIVIFASVFRFYRNEATVRILNVRDHVSKSQITTADISITSRDASEPEKENENFSNVSLPFIVPVEGGRCTLIGIEADGYHRWERFFCPSITQRIDIEIELIPADYLPPSQPDKFDA